MPQRVPDNAFCIIAQHIIHEVPERTFRIGRLAIVLDDVFGAQSMPAAKAVGDDRQEHRAGRVRSTHQHTSGVKSALEAAGIIFIDSNGSAPVFDFATRLDRSIFNSCRTARWSA